MCEAGELNRPGCHPEEQDIEKASRKRRTEKPDLCVFSGSSAVGGEAAVHGQGHLPPGAAWAPARKGTPGVGLAHVSLVGTGQSLSGKMQGTPQGSGDWLKGAVSACGRGFVPSPVGCREREKSAL